MNINKLIEDAYPPTEPDTLAQSRVESRTLHLVQSSRARRITRRLTLSLATGAAIVSLSAFFGPSAYAGFRIQQIKGMVDGAENAYFVTSSVDPSGRETVQGRMWYSKGRWRMEREGQTQIFSKGKLWTYDPDQRLVRVVERPQGPFTFNPSGFSASAMIEDFARWGWKDNVEIGTMTVSGKRLESLSISNGQIGQRSVILSDPQSHLPVEIRQETFKDGTWTLRQVQRTVFNHMVKETLFATVYPSGTTIVDAKAEESQIRESLETPVLAVSLADRKILVRHVFVNSRGHVFVLFTDGETAEDRIDEAKRNVTPRHDDGVHTVSPEAVGRYEVMTTLHDSLGTDYAISSSSFQPYLAGPSPEQCQGLVLRDRQVLQGAWFVPDHSGTWRGRSLTLTFKVRSGNDAHGPTYATTDASIEIQGASPALVPPWSSAMAISPKTDEAIVLGEKAREP